MSGWCLGACRKILVSSFKIFFEAWVLVAKCFIRFVEKGLRRMQQVVVVWGLRD